MGDICCPPPLSMDAMIMGNYNLSQLQIPHGLIRSSILTKTVKVVLVIGRVGMSYSR